MRPMLATPGEPPESTDWVHEVKWDGMRVLTDVAAGQVRVFSRTGRDITTAFPELADVAAVLQDALIDSEIIVLEAGVPSLSALKERLHITDVRRARSISERLPVTAMSFDLLRLYGVELLARPLTERRASLDKLELPDAHWQRSPLYDDGRALFSATRERGLEGIVSKRRASSYQPGRRSPDWIKSVHHLQQACVVGGWRPVTGSAREVGALLIGVPDAAGLRYAGRVGNSLSRAAAADLLRELTTRARDGSPFVDEVPVADALGAQWCTPAVVVEVRHLGWTENGRLRQAVLRGIRTDVEIEQVHRE